MRNAVLLIADHDTRLIVATALDCAGFESTAHSEVASVMLALRRHAHDVVVVDIDDAFASCQVILDGRRGWLENAVAVIGIGSDPCASVKALDAGVDDILTKPVRGSELLARVGAASRRRHRTEPSTALTLGDCRLDAAASVLASTRAQIDLTGRELALAKLLFGNAGQVVTRARIAQDIWGVTEDIGRHSIEQHVYQLRRKIRRSSGDTISLSSVYGGGYRLDLSASHRVDDAEQIALRPPSEAEIAERVSGRTQDKTVQPS